MTRRKFRDIDWLFIIPTLSGSDGGPPNAVLNVAAVLVARGDHVTVLAERIAGETPHNSVKEFLESGGKVCFVDRKRRSRVRISFTYALSCIKLIARAERVSVHGFYQFPNLIAPLVCILRFQKFTIQPHGVFEPYQESKSRLLKNIYMTVVGRALVSRSVAVLVASDSEADNVGTMFPKAVVAKVGVGVRQPRSVSSVRYRTSDVLFVSRIAKKKRLDKLIKALACTELVECDARLSVVGTGEMHYLRELQDLARLLGVGDRIEWLGHLEGDRLTEAYQSAGVFCLPSDNENYGQVVAEAMVNGLAVVTTTEVGASDHVERAGGGIALKAPSPADLARAVASLLDDEAVRERYGQMNQAYAECKLSWTAVVDRWVDIWRAAVA